MASEDSRRVAESLRETESALNRTTARLLALAETAPGAVMIESAEGTLELANEAFCLLLGLDCAPQSLVGLAVREVLVKAEGGTAAKLARQPIQVDNHIDGALWTLSGAGVAAGAPVVYGGPSEVALIEKTGEQLSVALEGISAIAIRAQQMEFDPALVEHFQRIRGSTESAMAAIGDLVDFSRVSGGIVLRKAEFGLRAALADLIKRVSAQAEERGCRLRMRIEQDVADRLEGDVSRLVLVLKNLVDNAFQLAPGAEVSLQVMPEYVTESGIQLSFSISAVLGGAAKLPPGASPESGMGVAVARFMVAAMGGKLAISSGPAESLYTFTIEFPVRPAPAPPKRPTFVSLVGLPVLIVSGDPAQRLAISTVLRGWRMAPLEADNAAMAVALLERMHGERSLVPLVIVTGQLLVQDGYLLAFRIKHHGRLDDTLLMMLASQGKPGDAIACRENGISAYMRYPVSERQLMVDTSRDSQILAAHILSKRECTVAVAQNAREALAALEQDFYDLVIVDASLPGLDMPSTPAKLREAIQRDPGKVRLIASTLDHTPAWSAARIAEGYDGSIGKPFNKEHLLEVLAELPAAPDEE